MCVWGKEADCYASFPYIALVTHTSTHGILHLLPGGTARPKQGLSPSMESPYAIAWDTKAENN